MFKVFTFSSGKEKEIGKCEYNLSDLLSNNLKGKNISLLMCNFSLIIEKSEILNVVKDQTTVEHLHFKVRASLVTDIKDNKEGTQEQQRVR